MGRDRGASKVNAVTLLGGLLVVIAVVLGAFTLSNPTTVEDGEPSAEGPYAVSVEGERLVVHKTDDDPVTYDQLLVYVSADDYSARIDIDEDDARNEDGDSLFERGETVVCPVPWTDRPAERVTVTLVDSVGSEMLYETAVSVSENETS